VPVVHCEPPRATGVSLRDTVLRHLVAPLAAAVAAVPSFAELLVDGLAAGRAAWPGVVVSDDRFAVQVAAAVRTLDDVAALPQLRFSELYLVAACADRDPVAAHRLAAHHRSELDVILRRLRLSPSQIDDVLQGVWEILLVGPGDGRPRIGDYRGRGELRRWLRAAVLRAAYRVLERTGRAVAFDDEELAAIPGSQEDLELEYLKRRYAAEFRAAFQAAVTRLSPRERALLRRHYLDGMTVDELGPLYGVHRATAARWIAEARTAALRATRRELHQRLQIGDREMASLFRLVESRLDLSLQRVLATSDED